MTRMRFHLELRASLLPVLMTVACVAIAQTGSKNETGSAAQPPPQDQEIRPPFSLMWHEPSERVEAKVEAAKLVIDERRKVNNRWVVVATGFKKPDAADPKAPKPPELRRVLFHFHGGNVSTNKSPNGKVREMLAGGQLMEVELQYEQVGWKDEDYSECMGEKRRMLERLYGQGQQIARSSQPTPDGNATQTIVGYKWNRNNSAVELIYFNVNTNGGEQAFHTISLHYKRS
jgi:hypothetical protein